MAGNRIRVLVVDDAVVYRKIVSDALADDPNIEVVGLAANGKIALSKIEQLQPDILTLDLEMPEMDGLEVLRRLQNRKNSPGAIVLSALTKEGAHTTLKSLQEGAFDFILKPSAESLEENKTILRQQLIPKIKACAQSRQIKEILTNNTRPCPAAVISSPDSKERAPSAPSDSAVAKWSARSRPEVIGIGISTGGPKALIQMLPQLPVDLNVPVLIVQHMPPMFTKSLANDLHNRCDWTVTEGQDGQKVTAGQIIIAPGGRQMKIQKTHEGTTIRITEDPPENNCRPSVDYLFRSIANELGVKSLAVIMTGMGSDGTLGCRLLKRLGVPVIAQDEASCVVYGMPRQVIEEGLAEVVCPLEKIAEQITRMVRNESALCR